MRGFSSDQGGAITPLMLSIFLGLVLVTGLGVEFARHEALRADVQDALDRGVLAAVQGGGARSPAAVVGDFLDTRALAEGRVRLEVEADWPDPHLYRVSASARLAQPSIVLGMLGVPALPVAASASASEPREALEIALILDISSSMRRAGKLAAMQAAASAFVREMLRPGAGDRVSISLVPYAGAVNPGPRLFYAIGGRRMHSRSSCPVLRDADFGETGLPAAPRYDQVPAHADWPRDRETMGVGWCPGDPQVALLDPRTGQAHGLMAGLGRGWREVVVNGTSITAHASDPATLLRRIEGIRLHHGSSPQEGLRWALALFDPESRDTLERHGQVVGRHERPQRWNGQGVRKIAILLSDGPISEVEQPDPVGEEGRDIFDTGPDLLSRLARREARAQFRRVCRLAAEKGVEVHAIALSAPGPLPDRVRRDLAGCADDWAVYEREQRASRFQETGPTGLAAAFARIRARLTGLRLDR
ncbi:MAG: Tad domain-containing protein [Pseudomonadota bacterium]